MARIKSDLSTILTAIKTRLTADAVLDTSRIFLSLTADDELTWPGNDMVIVVAPGSYPADLRAEAGGGNELKVFDGVTKLSLWVRLGLDQATRDDQWLTHATLGALAKWRLVMKSLNQHDLLSGTDQILEEPMRCIRFDAAPAKTKGGWARLTSLWETKWLQDLT